MFLFFNLLVYYACVTQKTLSNQNYAFSKYHTHLPTLTELDKDAFELYQKKDAAKTIRLWTGHAGEWQEFCHYYGLDKRDFSEKNLVRYTTFHFTAKGNAAGTARSHIYALRKIAHGLDNPIDVTMIAMPFLHGVRSGRKTERPPGKGARIITSELLNVWFTYPCFDPIVFDRQILRGAFAFANNCIRRSAEVIQQSFKGLRVENIYFDNGTHIPSDEVKGAMVIFHFSKGNQLGDEQCAPIFHWCERGYICFLCELIRIFNWRKKDWKLSMPIFQLANGKLLQYGILNKTIKQCCIRMNIIPEPYSYHGLRGGAAFDQKMLGVGNVSRELVAGWKSSATRIKYDKKIEPVQLYRQMAKEAGFAVKKSKFNFVNKLDKQRRVKVQIKDKEKMIQLKISNQKLAKLGLLPRL